MNNLNFNSQLMKFEALRVCLDIPKDTRILKTAMRKNLVKVIENAPWLTKTINGTVRSFTKILDPVEKWKETGEEMAITGARMCNLFIQNLDETVRQGTTLNREVCHAIARVFVEIDLNPANQVKYGLSKDGLKDILCHYIEKKLKNNKQMKEPKKASNYQPTPLQPATPEYSEEFYRMLDN